MTEDDFVSHCARMLRGGMHPADILVAIISYVTYGDTLDIS